jgi:hypothetical protein
LGVDDAPGGLPQPAGGGLSSRPRQARRLARVNTRDGNVGQSGDRGQPASVIGALRPRRNDRASIHGSHQGPRPYRAAATGRTHDRNWPPLHAREKLLRVGGHPHMTPQMAVIARSGATKQSRCEARWRESSVWFRPLSLIYAGAKYISIA